MISKFHLSFMIYTFLSVFITYTNGYRNLSITTDFRPARETLVCKQFDNKKNVLTLNTILITR